MAATQDRPAAVEDVTAQRDYLLGVLVDREVSARIARYVKGHGHGPRLDEREAWEDEARHRLAAALVGMTCTNHYVQYARGEL